MRRAAAFQCLVFSVVIALVGASCTDRSREELDMQATVEALQTQVASQPTPFPTEPLRPTSAPSPQPIITTVTSAATRGKILYWTDVETGLGVRPPPSAYWWISEDGTSKIRLELLQDVDRTHYIRVRAERWLIESAEPPDLLFLYFVPDDLAGTGKLLYVNEKMERVDLGSGFPVGENYEYEAAFSRSGKAFLLAGAHSDSPLPTLYLVKTDGSGVRALPYLYINGRICSDDATVVLARFVGQAIYPPKVTIEVQNLDGSGQRELVSGKIMWFEVSPDCNRVWVAVDEFDSTVYLSLYVLDRSGAKRLIREGAVGGTIEMAPDYRHLLFGEWPSDNWVVKYVASADGGQIVELGRSYYTSSVVPDLPTEFSHDGSRVVFSTTDERTGRQSLFTANADGSNKRELVNIPYVQSKPNRSPEEGLSQAVMSAKGNWIKASDWNQKQYVFSPDGQRFELPSGALRFWFSPSEKHFGFEVDDRYYIGDLTTQDWQQFFDGTTTGEVVYPDEILFSPDEERFAFSTLERHSARCAGGIYVGDTDSRQIQKILDEGCIYKWLFP